MDVLEKLLFNLDTIANIPRGKKIKTDQEFINIDDESMLQPLWRTITRDSRGRAVRTVQSTVETIILLIDLMIESKCLYIDSETLTFDDNCDVIFDIRQNKTEREQKISQIKDITYRLDESRIGIENLCDTYIDDANVIAALKPLIGRIDTQINKVSKILMSMGEITKRASLYKMHT